GIQYGSNLWASEAPTFTDFHATPKYGCQKDVRIPETLTEPLAWLLGIYAAEGHITRSSWTVWITHAIPEILARIQTTVRELFGLESIIQHQVGKCPQLVIHSKGLVEFLHYLGIGDSAAEKRIPDVILRSPRPLVLQFLRGLFLDGYLTVTR